MSRVGYGRTLGRRVGSPTSPTDRRTVGQIVNHVALAYPIEIDLARAGALVGDAAGYMDAITGEGLSLGFEQARLLAEVLPDAVAHGATGQSLARYEEGCGAPGTVPIAIVATTATGRPYTEKI